MCGGPRDVGSEWLAQATAGRLLRVEEVIGVIKKDVVQGGHRKNRALKKRLPKNERRWRSLWVSYKRRLVLRGGVEVIKAKKVARLKHDLRGLRLQGSQRCEKSKFRTVCLLSLESCIPHAGGAIEAWYPEAVLRPGRLRRTVVRISSGPKHSFGVRGITQTLKIRFTQLRILQ